MNGNPTRLKYLAELNPETLTDSTNPDYAFRYVDIGTTGRGYLNNEPEPMTFGLAPSRARRVLHPGDTILSTVRTYLRAAWTVRDAPDQLVASTGFVCLRPRDGVDARFLGWLAQSDAVIEKIVARSVGVSYPAISPEEVGRIEVPHPSRARQRAVADYLDSETERIDKLRKARQREVALVRERWLSMRLRAVTKGIGVAGSERAAPRSWLPGVPSHWTATKLSYLADIKSGGTPSTEREDYWGGGVPWVSPKDMKNFDIETVQEYVTEKALEETQLLVLEPGAVLFVVRGMILAHTFPVGINTMRTTINQDMKAAVPRSVEPRFLAHLLAGLAGPILALLVEESAHGTRALRMDRWKDLPLSVPSSKEQREIVQVLDREQRTVAECLAASERQVKLLDERRQALITAAVTGQLDISEAA